MRFLEERGTVGMDQEDVYQIWLAATGSDKLAQEGLRQHIISSEIRKAKRYAE